MAGGTVVLAPSSSGQSPPTAAPACKTSPKPPRLPLAKALTVYASPNPATAVRPVTVFGQLISIRHGVQPCGISITLWRRFPAQRGFAVIARTTTTAAGRYKFVFAAGTVATNRDWYVSASGLMSRVVFELVRPTVTLASTATFAVAGDMETFSGMVIPSQAGQSVSLQLRSGRRWLTVAQPRVHRGYTFSVAHTFTTGRTEQWRAVVPSSIHDLGAQSPVLQIRIAPLTGIHKIRHVVVIMQENRSFDSYFGTFPGADGIPPGVCVPDPANGGCVAPFHDSSDLNYGGPHGLANATADIDGGRMDGFVAQAEQGMGCQSGDPNCSPCTEDSQAQSSLPSCVERLVEYCETHAIVADQTEFSTKPEIAAA